MNANDLTGTVRIIGASHGGVNCAFALRREGWTGEIVLYDADPELPYHRPPLSKTYLSEDGGGTKAPLKTEESYVKDDIKLHLGVRIASIDRAGRTIRLADGTDHRYDKLIIATGGRAFLPPIPGLNDAQNVFTLRTAADANRIREAIGVGTGRKAVIVGGGYIGLEAAASMRKMGAEVTVVERESRVLARVTAPEMSAYFEALHREYGVEILTGKGVTAVETTAAGQAVICDDGTRLPTDLIVVGVGIRTNTELAAAAGLTVDNGLPVDAACRTEDVNIYAIGDCTRHRNPHYDRSVRLESVQNAVDQAKVAAAAITGKPAVYDEIPWFWSDQYDVKLQIVGLSTGYDNVVIREEADGASRSAWYFTGEKLLAVDAVNHGKAYVLGTRFLKGGQVLDKAKLADPAIPFKPTTFLKD